MSQILDGLLNQEVWYWAPSASPNEFGVYTPTAGSPVSLKAQWEATRATTSTPDGKTVTVSAVVSLSSAVVRNGWLLLKTGSTPPVGPDLDLWIKNVTELQDIDNEEKHWEVQV